MIITIYVSKYLQSSQIKFKSNFYYCSFQVHVRYCDAKEAYSVSVADSMSVAQLKRMVIGHFISPSSILGAVYQSSSSSGASNYPSDTPSADEFMLVESGDIRALAEEMSLAQEKIVNGGKLMLILKTSRISASLQQYLDADSELTAMRNEARARGLVMEHMTGPGPDESEVHHATKNLTPRAKAPRQKACSCKAMQPHNRLLLLRRVLLGVAHSSLRQLGDARLTQDTFLAILDRLERRHRSSMKPNSIRKLKEMGFCESKAVIALKLKSSPEEAAHYLTENNPHQHLPEAPNCSDLTPDQDPVEVLMPRFWHFRRCYFVPYPPTYDSLLEKGYDATRVFDALMQSENDESTASEVLESEVKYNEDLLYSPPPSQHPIMTSIFSNSVVLVCLHKPKVLYALLALCSNPSNANLWLSDPDTSGVVNLVLKVFYEERYNNECSIAGPH